MTAPPVRDGRPKRPRSETELLREILRRLDVLLVLTAALAGFRLLP